MNDLIKDEAEFIRNCATDIETGEPLDDDQMCNMYVIDAHRIADLIDAVEERNKELTLQLLAVHGQAADALDKLAKAVEALREIITRWDTPAWKDAEATGSVINRARTVLAELEGGE
jgi:hypothetical protein